MKKVFLKIFHSKPLFFLAVTTTILTLNLTPLISHFRHSPAGRTFALIHNNAQDFFFYQSLMNRGASSNWLTTDPYTSEPHQPSIIFAYFVWLGKIAKLLNLPYPIMYHFLRIILSIFFLITSYFLLLTSDIPLPRLAFLFFVFAAPLMHKINDGGKIISVPFMNWWTGMDPIRRAAYLPHHMVGSLLLVVTVIFLLNYVKSKIKNQKSKIQLKIQNYNKYLLYAILLAPILAFVHTPSLFIILLMLPPALIVYSLITPISPISLIRPINSKCKLKNYLNNLSNQSNLLLPLFFYWLLSLFFLLIMLSQTNRGFPWSQYISWEKNLQFPLKNELVGAFGILLPFCLIGIIKALRSKRFEYILAASWFIIPLILIPFAPYLNISNIRLIQGVPYLPLAILATLGLQSIGILLKKVLHKSAKLQFKVKSLFSNTFLLGTGGTINIIITVLFLVFTIPTLSWSIKDQIREYWPIFGNVYLDNRMSKAFAFIDQNFPKNTITLSTFYTGNYLPAFTHTTSFIGHFGYTYNIDSKQKEVMRFFKNEMTKEQAKDFLLSNNFALIFQGPEEKPLYNDYLHPNILKVVYDEQPVTLYVPIN